MDTRETLFAALHAAPGDELAWMALADWFEEAGQTQNAEHVRLMTQLRHDLDAPERPAREDRLRDLLGSGFKPFWPTLTLKINRAVALTAMLIPPGVFRMGCDVKPSSHGEEGPAHTVRMTRPYYIGMYPVRQNEWRALMRETPSSHADLSCPVERVNWLDCTAFCDRLSEHSGRRVRLPTEAEWEYACRAGTSSEYHSGDGEEAMARAGAFGCEQTRPVGQGQPNGFGVFDMHGNVWEWTLDAYADYPKKGATRVNPRRVRYSDYRAARGGAYNNSAECGRSASRIGFAAGGRNTFIGCRVVIELP